VLNQFNTIKLSCCSEGPNRHHLCSIAGRSTLWRDWCGGRQINSTPARCLWHAEQGIYLKAISRGKGMALTSGSSLANRNRFAIDMLEPLRYMLRKRR